MLETIELENGQYGTSIFVIYREWSTSVDFHPREFILHFGKL